MTLNRNQKIATIVFGIGIIVVVLFLTPYEKDEPGEHYGDLFLIYTGAIEFTKFFIELGLLVVLYLLSLLVLKDQ